MNDTNAASHDMITEEERDEYFHSDIIQFAFMPEGEPEWGFSINCNALYKIDIRNATAEYVSSVPQEKNMSYSYYFPMEIKNELFLSPALARSFAIYNIGSGEWTKIPIPADATPERDTHPAFGGVVHCGDYLLIAPGVNGVFAKYDIESGEFSFYDHWFNQLKNNNVDTDKLLLHGCCCIDGKMYLTSPQCNLVTELNPTDMSFVLHQVGKKGNAYCDITRMKDSFWLIKYPTSEQNDLVAELVEWRSDTGKCVEHTDLPVTRDESRTGRAFSHIIIVDDDLYLFPWHSDNIIKFNPTTKKRSIFKPKPEFNYFESKGRYYTWNRGTAMPLVIQEDNLSYPWKRLNASNSVAYIQSPTDYSLIRLDLSTGEYIKKKWYVKGAKRLLARIENPDSMPFAPRHEAELYSLDYFLKELVSGELPAVDMEKLNYFRSLQANSYGYTGEKIYEYIKKLVL